MKTLLALFTAAALLLPLIACSKSGGAQAAPPQPVAADEAQAEPKDAIEYFARGGLFLFKRDYENAIADFTQALRLNPNLAAAYNSRGLAYEGKGDYDRATADYETAFRIDPTAERERGW